MLDITAYGTFFITKAYLLAGFIQNRSGTLNTDLNMQLLADKYVVYCHAVAESHPIPRCRPWSRSPDLCLMAKICTSIRGTRPRCA